MGQMVSKTRGQGSPWHGGRKPGTEARGARKGTQARGTRGDWELWFPREKWASEASCGEGSDWVGVQHHLRPTTWGLLDPPTCG